MLRRTAKNILKADDRSVREQALKDCLTSLADGWFGGGSRSSEAMKVGQDNEAGVIQCILARVPTVKSIVEVGTCAS